MAEAAGDGPDPLLVRTVDVTGLNLRVQYQGTEVLIDTLVIGQSTQVDHSVARRLVGIIVIGGCAVLVVLLLVAVLAVGRGLRPIERMARQASAVAAGRAGQRLSTNSADSSVRHLADAVNAAFETQQRAESRMREFIADASHELRTPLTVSAGWIEHYLRGGLADEAERDHAMGRVSVQLDRMRSLVDDLSLLARIDARRPISDSPVDIGLVSAETVSDARVLNPDRTIILLDNGPALTRGDQNQIFQVARNVIENALNYTPQTSVVTVTVTAAAHHAPGATHVLSVRDQGPGVSHDQLPHVFDRFWRGEASRNRKTGGSGLGLSIVRSIVHAHGGTIIFESSVEAGTTVTIRLPAR